MLTDVWILASLVTTAPFSTKQIVDPDRGDHSFGNT